MTEEQPRRSADELTQLLSRIGVPESIFFYIVLGMISSARKLAFKAAAEGCPPEDMNCVDFTDEQPGAEHPTRYEKEGFTFIALDKRKLRVIGWGVPTGETKLLVPNRGLEVRLPYQVDQVIAYGAQYTGQPLVLTAFNNGEVVAEAKAPEVQNTLHTLQVEAEAIDRVILSGGGGEGLLFRLCVPDLEPVVE